MTTESSVRRRRRALVTLAVVLILASVFAQAACAWGLAADRDRRAQENVARESSLYQQLSNRDAILESQRRMYMERSRRLEAQLGEPERDLAVLRERLVTGQNQRAIADQGNRVDLSR